MIFVVKFNLLVIAYFAEISTIKFEATFSLLGILPAPGCVLNSPLNLPFRLISKSECSIESVVLNWCFGMYGISSPEAIVPHKPSELPKAF